MGIEMTKNPICRAVAAVIAASTLLCQSFFISASNTETQEERTTVMLSLRDDGDTASMRKIIKAMDSRAEFMKDYGNVMHGFALTTTTEVAQRLKAFGVVEDIYQSRVFDEDKASESESGESTVTLNEGWAYRGEGMVAAVIDSSFDTGHEMFALSDPSTAAITKSDIDGLLAEGGLSISNYAQYMSDRYSPYVSAKVPFAFDYCDYDFDVSNYGTHGTHVAGIIGANNIKKSERGFDGVAPECQLLMMKVSRDDRDGLYEYAIMYALDDAITLGADVVNMSFSIAAGSVTPKLSTYNYNSLIEKASELGIVVVCSAGNENMLGAAGNFDTLYGIDMPLCSNPDYGLVGSPSTYKEAFSVASVDNPNIIISDYILSSSGKVIKYTLPSVAVDLSPFARPTSYVAVGGLGEEKDYDGLDVRGKIALIQRGSLSFIEKIKYAAAAGAVGAVIYDKEDSGENFSMKLDSSCRIPAVSISYSDGLTLLSESAKTLTFKNGVKTVFKSETGGQISSFSSRGMTADLSIKPEIAAVGGDVYSSIHGGYTVMSGTSMSSPYTAGAALLVRQMLKEDGTDSESTVKVRRILMSTASTVTDSSTGVEYSPRTQGAGLVDISAALKCGVTLYSSDSLTKIELGDKLGRSFEATFAVRNDTDRDIEYNMSASVTSDAYTRLKCGASYNYFITGSQTAFESAVIKAEGSDVNINKYRSDSTESVTVGAGETKYITLTIEIDRKSFREYEKVFENGFFAEGFIWLTPRDAKETALSIPYSGFCGDWEEPPVFTGEVNSHENCFYTQSAYSYFYAGGKLLAYDIGKSLYIKDDIVNPELLLISPNGDKRGDYISLELMPLRNISSLSITIVSSNGEIVCVDSEEGFTSKSVYDSTNDAVTGYNIQYIWNGSDYSNINYRMPDGDYTLTVKAVIEGGESESEWSMNFSVDTVRPKLENAYIKELDGRTLLYCTVSDNYALQYVGAYLGDKDYGESYTPAALDAEEKCELVFDITEAAGEKYIYLDVLDFAANLTTERLVLADLIRK